MVGGSENTVQVSVIYLNEGPENLDKDHLLEGLLPIELPDEYRAILLVC